MATFSFKLDRSKVVYAYLRQSYAVVEKIQTWKTEVIGEYFPNVATQWENIRKILDIGISKKIAVTGTSITKSDDTPDETRIPPTVEINSNIIRVMKNRATDLSVTLSGDYEFFDDTNNFQEAFATWSGACNAYLTILNMEIEISIYKYAINGMYRVGGEMDRGVGQMSVFDKCDVPLGDDANAIFVSVFNWDGIEEAFDEFYDDMYLEPAYEISSGTIQTYNIQHSSPTANKADDPDNPGTKTIYEFDASSGFNIIGLITAKDSDGDYHYNTTEVYYTSATKAVVRLSVAVGSAPASVTALMYEAKMT
jgi:hypothetical protein